MAITGENRWWQDVLEHGQASPFAQYFDVDWDPPESKLRDLVLLPVLGDHYGRVIEAGDLRIERRGGTFVVVYLEHCWPVAPPTYDAVLHPAAARSGSERLDFLGRSFHALPRANRTEQAAVVARHRDSRVLKGLLAELLEEEPELAQAVDDAAAAVSGDPDRLDALLQRQNYRLAFWRTAVEELDYRRFFDVTSLAGLRVERDEVFEATHAVPLRLVEEGVLDGLRIDHPDGLRDPGAYLARLRERAPDTWLVVEKILEPGEELPEEWPVDGTTGYDFLALADGVLVDPEGESPLTRAYGELTGEPTDYEEVVAEAKRTVLREVLAADVRRLAQLFVEVCESNRRYRDHTRSELEDVLREVLASFAVYRTYVRPGGEVRAEDAAQIDAALAAARAHRPDLDEVLLGLLGDVLRGEVPGPGAELCLRFQQASGPAMAKGVEDTSFYRYSRLLARNEVGADPGRFALDVPTYHRLVAARRGMNGTSTHDTKRSEDVRSRLAVLSEIPDEVAATFGRWLHAHDGFRHEGQAVDPDFRWALYQTLVGAHPLPVERAQAWAEKATREAKRYTSWLTPVPAYDEAVQAFVASLYDDPAFLAELDAFASPLVAPGRSNGLALQVLKLVAPGVPDLYQGTELWDLSLVDPDNRRAVDYDRRRALLTELDSLPPDAVAARADDGLAKLHVTRVGLRLRRERRAAFDGSYEPLPGDEHCIAAVRGGEVAAIVTRLPLRLARSGGWDDRTIELPPGPWHDELTGATHAGGRSRLADLLSLFPVAFLTRS
jgi:(1->4)-alpha-D-glucan 1-alpha-D-glucosylmutase